MCSFSRTVDANMNKIPTVCLLILLFGYSHEDERADQHFAYICETDDPVGYAQVNTTSGFVTGVTTLKSHVFWGIPYAQPPVGDLRFQPPKPILTPLGNINATKNHFLQCFQSKSYESLIADGHCPTHLSEDCLILNVFVPSAITFDTTISTSKRLPVLFFIHGGSFKAHSGNQPRHNAVGLANATNTIVVTINYRLGPFGFLVHHQKEESDLLGNQGLKDQQLAMRWVQDNIENFGGDKEKVTIFGNSAGAQSVMFHTLSNVSRNLFSNSIQQSNPAIMSFYAPTMEIASRVTDKLLQKLGCNGNRRKCLIDSTAEAIVEKTSEVETMTYKDEGIGLYLSEAYQPVVDGVEFADQPVALYRDGKWNSDKHMIIGVSTQEFENIEYSYPYGFVMDVETFFDFMKPWFDEETASKIGEKYATTYNLDEADDMNKIFWKIYSHYYFNCPSRLLARLASNTTSSSVYFYVNDRKILDDQCFARDGNKSKCYFAFHASEIEYIFRTFEKVRNDNYTADDLLIENLYSTYWGNFAHTGNPSSKLNTYIDDLPIWPEYKNDKDPSKSWLHLMIQAPRSTIQNEYLEEICDFWDSIKYGVKDEGSEIPNATEVASTSPSAPTTSSGENGKIMHKLLLIASFLFLYFNV
ncbi:crystal protein-like [Styela clava]